MNEHEVARKIEEQINSVFVGKETLITNLLIALFAGGHILLEDVPGVGKTTLAKALASVMDCSFGRIQFTPDTLPGDIVGVSVYNMKSGEFEFRQGVVMNQILLADEINRTSPKTQASLLEAMEERQVTVDGACYPLEAPFMVIATQNPIEFLGTYPLPEAQLDRFFMKLSIGYPNQAEAIRLANLFLEEKTVKVLQPICESSDILKIQEKVKTIKLHPDLIAYTSEIIEATRKEERFVLGASPRAMLAMLRGAQASAFLADRDYCTPDDIKKVAEPILAHRLVLTTEARLKKTEVGQILKSVILKVKVPIVKE